MENQKQKKSVGTVLLVILLLIVTIASLILATYAWAKYTTSTTGEATADVAKWNVQFGPGKNEFSQTYQYVAPNNMAPGTSGKVAMTISSNETEVAYKYTIKMTGLKNKPTNVKFYKDSEFTQEIAINNNSGLAFENTVDVDSSSHKAAITKEDASPVIYWKWAYETTSTDILNNIDSISSETKLQQIEQDLKTFAERNSVTITKTEGTNKEKIKTYIQEIQNKKKEPSQDERAIPDTDIAKVINDAIDTIDGNELGEQSMSFTVEFTATQVQPSPNE